MADRWIYAHAGAVQRPVSYDQLKQLAASGDLLPTDRVWPEGGDPQRAVEAQAVVNFAALPRSAAVSSAWLGKVQDALRTSPRTAGTTPDWVADVAAQPAASSTASAATRVAIGKITQVAEAFTYPPRLLVSGASSRGRMRARNEDRFQIQQWRWNDATELHEVAVFVVADGIGGYQAGDEASQLTVSTVAHQLSFLVAAATGGRVPTPAGMTAAVDLALREAHQVVSKKAKTEMRCKDMGATAAVVMVLDGHAYFSHVGDCRVYLHRAGKLKQLTEDHTLVARMVALGQLTAREAAQHQARNEVTRAIGKRTLVEPSRGNLPLSRGDYMLVACDGLEAHVTPQTIEEVLNTAALPAQHLAAHLVHLADERGGSDNCTVVAAHFC